MLSPCDSRYRNSRQKLLQLFLFILGLNCAPLWAGDGRLGLLESYTRALAYDATLAAAREKYLADQEGVAQAEAHFFPEVGLTGNYTVADYEKTGVTSNPIERRSLELNATQMLFNQRISRSFDRAQRVVDVSELQLEGERQLLAQRVVESYLGVLLAERDLQLFEAETESYRFQWKKVSAALEMGLANQADVLDAKARNDEGLSRVLIAKRELESQRFELQRRIGNMPGAIKLKVLSEGTYKPGVFDSEQWIPLVIKNNIPTRVAAGELSVSHEAIKVERAEHYPVLNLQAGVAYADDDDPAAIQGRDARLSLVLNVPLYRGGYTSSRVRQALAIQRQSEERLREVSDDAILQARQVLYALETSQANIDVLRLALKAREKSLEAAEASRKVGLKDLSDVLDVQARLYQTRRELSRAVHDHLVSRVRLYVIAGLLTKDKLNELDGVLIDR